MHTAENGTRRSPAAVLLLAAIPVALLAAVIVLFLKTGGAGLKVEPAAPQEALVFERRVLTAGMIELHVRNTSPREITIAQVDVRDAFVPFRVDPAPTVPRLGRAVVRIPYPWVQAEAYSIRLFTANSVPFDTTIDVAAETKHADGRTLASFTLVGLYVGVLPVFLGMFWLPVLRRLGRKTFLWLMAITVGLLLYIGIEAASEALESAASLGGPLQGVGLAALGILATALLLYALARAPARLRAGAAASAPSANAGSDSQPRTRIAAMIALGIGLHNLGEGLAIGGAFALGAASLGTFLVIGFVLQNLTEGLGIIAPLVKEKPPVRVLAGLGLLGGAPAIAGTWVGGLASSPILSVLFLSVGAGAVFEVAWEVARLTRQDPLAARMPFRMAGGAITGMSLLYAAGLLIK